MYISAHFLNIKLIKGKNIRILSKKVYNYVNLCYNNAINSLLIISKLIKKGG